MKFNYPLRAACVSLLLILISAFAFASSGIFQTYAIYDAGGGNVFRAGGINSDLAAVFDGTNLGSFNITQTLKLNGGEIKTFKNGGSDVTAAHINYRVYLITGVGGAFTQLNLPFNSDLGGGDQKWQQAAANINLLAGRAPGTYYLEVYWDITGTDGDQFDSNGGNNYKATFTVTSLNVDVSSTGGTSTYATYSTLKGAFDAVNAGTHTGTIAISVYGSTAEPVGGAILNASGSGSASYTTMSVQPAGGAARTITGAATAGLPLVDFNGADNVTVDGLNSGGNSLTISNTTVSATSGTSTIRFQTDATSNVITRCSVLGSCTMAVGTNGGNIWFGSAAITTGNDNNTVSFCDIGPAGANLPTKGIYFSGTSNTLNNSGNTINNNNIFDYFNAATTSAGVYITTGTTDCIISNNKFYQTASRTQTSGAQHSAIWITNTTSTSGYNVTGNTIGFASSSGTGTYGFVAVSSGSVLIPIFLSVGTTVSTSIQGNTIAGIAMSGAGSGTSSSGAFRGIYVAGGLTNVGDITGNTIGSMSATGSITYTSTSSSASDVIGIFNFGSSNWISNNNNVGGITASNSSTGAANIYPIRCFTGSTVTWICTNNTIGGTVANSIQSTSTSTSTIVNGILNSSPIGTITGNIIRNLTTAGGTGTTSTASLMGITVTTSAAQTITSNTINTLSGTGASTAIGIIVTSTGSNTISKNKIYDLQVNNASGIVYGIQLSSSGTTVNVINNLIGDLRAPSSTVTSPASAIIGINLTSSSSSSTINVYYNTVNINASSSGANFATTGIFHTTSTTSTTAALNLRNNIIVNTSTPAGTGLTVAYRRSSGGANTLANYVSTSNNNLFYAGTPGASNLIYSDGTGSAQTIAAYKAGVFTAGTIAPRDAASISENPTWVSTSGSSANFLHINTTTPTGIESGAVNISGFADDFDGNIRQGNGGYSGTGTAPDIGGDEFELVLANCTTAIGGTTSGTATICSGTGSTVTATGYSNGTGTTYQWEYSSDNFVSDVHDLSGQTNPASAATGNLSASTYFRLRVSCATNSSTDYSTPNILITVNPIPSSSISPSGPITTCSVGTQVLTANTSGGSPTYQWVLNGSNVSGATASTYTPVASGSYTVIVTSGGCSATSTAVSVTINQTPSTVTVTPSSVNLCSTDPPTTLVASGGAVGATSQLGSGVLVTVGNTTSSTLGPNPLQIFYGGNKQLMLFTAAELSGLGMVSGSQLSAIGFNLVTADNTIALQNLQVKIQNTILTTLSSFVTTGWTVVRNPANFTTATGWNTITFNSNYTWDGSSNLLIEVNYSNNNGGTTGSTFNTALYGTTSNTSTLFYRADNTTAAAMDTYSGAPSFPYTFRNNIQLTYSAQAPFTWSPSTGLNTTTGATVSASPTTTTTYTATATMSGCSSAGTSTVNVTTATAWYADGDVDGYGNPSVSQMACTQPSGYVANNTDCNDGNAAVNPGATEVCNLIDDDCDTQIDEGVQLTFYADADGDGFGDPAVTTMACTAPVGYVSNNTDCNDADNSVHSMQTYYADTDLDGFGDPANSTTVCSSTAPAGYVSNNSDCDDTQLLYADGDADTYGAGAPVACGVANNTDCNDANAAIHPGATEICGNGLDDDCNTFVDDGCTTYTYYADADGDGFGNAAHDTVTNDNTPPSGFVSNSSDCDDTQLLYADGDNDNYGAGAPVACGVANNTDCNDANAAVNPGATEVCNNTDDDCDTQIDEGLTYTLYYVDADNDTYGSALDPGTLYCANPGVGYSINNTDCNDANAAVHPGANEICNSIDDDCDGNIDNVASPTASFTVSCNPMFPGNTSLLTSTSTAGSGTIASYQWNLNGSPISGATNATYTTGVNANGDYSLKVTNSNSCSNTSSNTTLTNQTGALAGTYSIPSSCGFATIASAVNYINTTGLSGSVVFNVAAGYTETAPSGGIVINQCALATGLRSSATQTVTFQKSGGGANPKINAFTGTSTTVDGIVKIVGGDYITFDAIDVSEVGGNVTATTQMEWGYALLKCDGNNGANNNTIKNCVITLNKANTVSVGLYSGNHNATSTTGLTYSGLANDDAQVDASRNGRNILFGNTISNVYTGISLNGNASSSGSKSLNDTLNQIGVIAQTANSITNFGGLSTATNAVIETNQRGLNIDNNSINGGTSSTGAVTGISMVSGVWGNVRNNVITLASSGTTAAMIGITVGFSGGSATNPNIINITGNTIQNISYTTATTAAFTGVICSAGGTSAQITVSNNAVQNNTVAGTGTWIGITSSSAPSGGTVTLSNNTVSGNVCSNVSTTAHTMTLMSQSASPTNMFLTGNTVNNNTHSGVGTMNGCICSGSPTNLTYSTNAITNNTMTGGAATCTITNMQAATSIYTMNGNTVSNNGVTNMTGTSTATVVGFTNSASASSETITNNTFRRLYVTGASTGTHTIRGMLNNILSTTARTVSGNRIDSLYSTGSATITGITSNAGGTVLYSKNRIFNLIGNGANSIVTGILVTSGTQVGVFNNYIGDLLAPAATGANAVIGISNTGSTALGLYYNTIRLSGGGGATFGSSGVSVTTTNGFEMRNNIIDNLCTPGSTSGNVVAYRRSTTGFGGYTTASNNNMFYAGTPAANQLIYFDGTNSSQTLSAYQTLVATRDQASVTENVSFASITPGASNYLHVNTAIATQTESGATNVTGITDDYDGDIRQGNPGYVGTGSAPDMGADEFAGVSPVPQITNVTVPTGGACTSVDHVINADVTTATGTLTSVTLNYNNGAPGSTPMTFVSGNTYTATIPGASPTNTNVTWSITATNDVPFSKTFTGATYNDATPSATNVITVTATTPSFCGVGGTTTLTAASNDLNYAYTWASLGTGTLSTTSGPSTDATVTETSSFTVTGVDGACQSSTTYSVGVYIFPTVVPTATPTTVCTGNTSTLSSGVSSLSFSVASTPYAFVSSPPSPTLLCSSGVQSTTVSTGTLDDGGWFNIPIGFSFNYFGTNYSTVNVSTNGNIQFGATSSFSTSFSPGAIPNTAVPNNFIAVCWSDLLFTTTGTIRYFITGTSPNRKFVVEYNGPFYNAGSPIGNLTGQVWLFETTGQVEVHLTQSNGLASTGGGVKSLGVENLDGTIGAAAPGRNGTAWQTTIPEAWHFEPPHNYTFNWQPSAQISGSNTTTSVTATPVNMPYTVYTVFITDPVTTCSGTFNDTVFVQTYPSAPSVSPDVTINAGETTILTASGSGSSFAWYSAPTGGSPLASTASYTTAPLCITTTFYAEQSNGPCPSPSRSPVVVTVTPLTAPTITPSSTSVCGNTTTTLVSSSPAIGSIKWYDAPTGGTLVYTGTSFTTPVLSATTTYYAAEENATCSSPRTAVTVNWTAPVSITLTNPNPVFCGSASVVPVNLSVSSADNDYVYSWAESIPGTLNTLSGNSVTATVTASTTYTVTAVNSGTGCSTASTTSISVFSFPVFTATATPPAICSGQSSVISAGVSASNFAVASIPYAGMPAPGSGITTLCEAGANVTTPTTVSISLDDQIWGSQPIGFNFNFFGNIYNTVNISSNGNLQFTSNLTTFTPGSLPTTTITNFIAPFWTDLYEALPASAGFGIIRYWVSGSAPNRIFVVDFTNCGHYNVGLTPTAYFTGQVWMYETTGVVETHLGSITGNTFTWSTGVNNLTGSLGAAAPNRNNNETGSFLNTTNEAWRFSPPVNYVFSWTSDPAGFTSTAGSATVTPTVNTEYDVLVTDPITNCQKTDSVSVTVNPLPAVSVTPVAPTICGGTSVSLTASGDPATYTWAPSTGLSATTGTSVLASPASGTTYTVTGTSAAGCTGTATSVITVTPGVNVTATATPDSICTGGTSSLVAVATVPSGPASLYSFSGLTGQTYSTLTGLGITVINTTAQLTPGFATGSQDDGGVLVTLPFTFTYMGNPFTQMSFSTNGWVAAGDISTISSSFDHAGGNLFSTNLPNNTIAAWFKDMGANFPTGHGSMRHGLIGTGVYAFQWDSAVGSGFSDGSAILISFQVNIYGPASTAPGRIDIIYGPTAGAITFAASEGIEDATGGTNHYLNALTGNGTSTTTSTAWPGNGNGYRFNPTAPAPLTYSWSPSTYLDNDTISNPTASGVTTTTAYTVTATNSAGCSGTASDTVVVVSADPAFTGLDPDYCADAGAVLLTPVTPGGVFSGTGVILFGTDYYFDPSTSGVGGPFTITYTTMCASSAQNTSVHSLPVVTIDPFPAICTDAGPLLLTGGSPAGGVYFDFDGFVDGTYFYPAAAGAGPHTIYYAFSDPFGCSSLGQQDITVEPAATVDAGPDQTICAVSSASLSGSFGGSASSSTWTTSGDGTFANASNPSTTYTPGLTDQVNGFVTLTLTTNDPAGACGAVSDALVVTLTTPAIYYADLDSDGYGAGVPILACGQPAGTSTNNTDCNDNNAAVNPGATDVCNGIDDNCNGQTDENPLVATISPSGTVSDCKFVPVTLTANTESGLTYQWYKNNVAQAGATNSTYITTKKGDFKVVESNAFCSGTSPVTTIARLATPRAFVGVFGNLDICATGSVLMRANKAQPSSHAYQWKKGGLPIFGATDRLFTATSTGDYTVTLENTNGCSATSDVITVTSSCKGSEPPALFSAELSLYPNPNHGDFAVELHFSDDVNSEADVVVMNTLGQTVYLNRTAVVNGELFDEVKFDKDVAAGNYFVRVIVGDKVYTGQIIYQQ